MVPLGLGTHFVKIPKGTVTLFKLQDKHRYRILPPRQVSKGRQAKNTQKTIVIRCGGLELGGGLEVEGGSKGWLEVRRPTPSTRDPTPSNPKQSNPRLSNP